MQKEGLWGENGGLSREMVLRGWDVGFLLRVSSKHAHEEIARKIYINTFRSPMVDFKIHRLPLQFSVSRRSSKMNSETALDTKSIVIFISSL